MGIVHSQITRISSQIQYAVFPPNPAEIAHLIVEVEQGKLRGKESTAKFSRKKYCSFLGVPYAKPPLGELRFMPPQPCEPWKTVYNATYERTGCKQFDPLLMLTLGGEDCLHMNIFTPKPPNMIKDPLPVMMFVHGGGFNFSSGSRILYGADHLINHDIILVVLNYRMNIFGFLDLGIKECPGNAGIKDVAFALQWVKRNIRKFGGDPENITLFGQSAGGNIIRYLQISPLGKGLFSKAIIQSPFPHDTTCTSNEDPIKLAFRIGAKLGYVGTDRVKLVQHLKKLSCSELYRVIPDLAYEVLPKAFILGPTVESIAEGAAIPPNFEELIKHSTPMPTIYGCNPGEGSVYFLIKKRLQGKIKCCMDVLRDNFKINPDLHQTIDEQVKNLYFGDKEISNSTATHLTSFMTDMFTYHMPDDINSLIETKAPIYLYRFTYLGRLNAASVYTRLWFPWLSILNDFKEAQHGDELGYLFYFKIIACYPPLSDSNMKMIDRMTTMWTNFAKTGNPSTSEVKWIPTSFQDMRYLEINDSPEMKSGFNYSETLPKLHEILDPVVEELL